MTDMKILRTYLAILVATWGLILLPSQAMAYDLLWCDGSGGVGGGSFFYTDAGAAESFCEYQDLSYGLTHIFSQIACDFTTVLNVVLGKIYCGIQFTLAPIVAALLTLYICIWGVQLLMGTSHLTAKEMVTHLLKIACVWVFVTESAWGISMAFLFFLDLANQGVWWALSPIHGPISMPGAPQGGLSNVMPAYTYLDDMIFRIVTGPVMAANSKLIGFFAIMCIVFPPIFGIALYWFKTTIVTLAQALISFLLSISALAFLISLSPIFMSFMLFKVTYGFFENWLKFMISYSLQIAIVFACIALWAMATIKFVGFFTELSDVIYPMQTVGREGAPIAVPNDSLGICPYQVALPSDPGGTPDGLPHLRCTDVPFDPIAQKDELIALSDLNQEDPDHTGTQNALNILIYYVIYYLITLTIICYAFDALLKKAPEIAKQLAGPEYVPVLGQGFGYVGYGRAKGASPTRVLRPVDQHGLGGPAGGKNVTSDAISGLLKQVNQRMSKLRG
jgi:hypothetical protein